MAPSISGAFALVSRFFLGRSGRSPWGRRYAGFHSLPHTTGYRRLRSSRHADNYLAVHRCWRLLQSTLWRHPSGLQSDPPRAAGLRDEAINLSVGVLGSPAMRWRARPRRMARRSVGNCRSCAGVLSTDSDVWASEGSQALPRAQSCRALRHRRARYLAAVASLPTSGSALGVDRDYRSLRPENQGKPGVSIPFRHGMEIRKRRCVRPGTSDCPRLHSPSRRDALVTFRLCVPVRSASLPSICLSTPHIASGVRNRSGDPGGSRRLLASSLLTLLQSASGRIFRLDVSPKARSPPARDGDYGNPVHLLSCRRRDHAVAAVAARWRLRARLNPVRNYQAGGSAAALPASCRLHSGITGPSARPGSCHGCGAGESDLQSAEAVTPHNVQIKTILVAIRNRQRQNPCSLRAPLRSGLRDAAAYSSRFKSCAGTESNMTDVSLPADSEARMDLAGTRAARVRRLYRAEARFRAYGLVALAVAGVSCRADPDIVRKGLPLSRTLWCSMLRCRRTWWTHRR